MGRLSRPGPDIVRDSVDVEVVLPISREASWHILTDPIHLRNWFGSHVSLDARLHGEFRKVWSQGERKVITSGRIDEYDAPHRIGWSWSDDHWTVTTHLRLMFEPMSSGTAVRLLHSGWGDFPEPLGQQLRDAHEAGWRGHLASLERYAGQHASRM